MQVAFTLFTALKRLKVTLVCMIYNTMHNKEYIRTKKASPIKAYMATSLFCYYKILSYILGKKPVDKCLIPYSSTSLGACKMNTVYCISSGTAHKTRRQRGTNVGAWTCVGAAKKRPETLARVKLRHHTYLSSFPGTRRT